MNLTEVWELLKPLGVCSFVILLGSLIKITPLQINLWDWLARKIGNALNHDIMLKITSIEKKQTEMEQKLDLHIKENEVDLILRARKNILDFCREILVGNQHTQEEFVEILSAIDTYENYCKTHPEFPNNRAVLAIKLIKENYEERLAKADFLTEGYRTKKEEH